MIMTLERALRANTGARRMRRGYWWAVSGSRNWSTAVSRWMMHRIEQQALAESVFASRRLSARARRVSTTLDNDLDECYRNLVAKQIARGRACRTRRATSCCATCRS